TASDTATSQVTSSTFTDKAQINLDQWADGAAPDQPVSTGSQKDQWQNGNLGASQAHYLEGESVPYRGVMTGLEHNAKYYVDIQWDTTKGGKHALDYLTTWDVSFPVPPRNETYPDPASGTSQDSTLDASLAIPVDPHVQSAGVTQVPGHFAFFGNFTVEGFVLAGPDGKFRRSDDVLFKACADGIWGTGDDVIPTGHTVGDIYTLTGSYSEDSSTSATVLLDYNGATGGDAVLAWGGHIATRDNWGE